VASTVRITAVDAESLSPGASTPGVLRELAAETESATLMRARAEVGAISGWHHHGDRDVLGPVVRGRARCVFGGGGRHSTDVEEGGFFHVPARLIHRDVNPGDAPQEIVLTVVGSGPLVVNVDGPATDAEDRATATAGPLADAQSILELLQAALSARDADALVALFDDPAVLIGTAGDGRNREALQQYLRAVATQPESFRWDWREVIPFHHGGASIGFAAFGEIVVANGDGERRAPIRLTIFAVLTPNGWRLRQFHGSIPFGF
jgi:uncharacterized RmlC-like cupin family protein